MRARGPFLATLGLLTLLPLAARAATEPMHCPNAPESWTPQQLFAHTADWPRNAPPNSAAPKEFGVRPGTLPGTPRERDGAPQELGVASREAATITLYKAPANATFLAAARLRPTDRTDPGEEKYEGSRATILSRQNEDVVLRLEAPTNRSGFFDERWLFAVAICAPDDRRLLGYGVTELSVNPRGLSLGLAGVLIVAVYLGCAFAALRCNERRLSARWAEEATRRDIDANATAIAPPGESLDRARSRRAALWARRRWQFARALDPVFVTQDAFGHGSLGRLQLLAFTLAVGFVVLNILLATGAIAALSDDVLFLLGISVVGTGVSRWVPSQAGLSAAARQWIAERRVLRSTADRLPLWRDLVASDGEIDVTRVQALVFSLVTLLALVISGAGDLSNFSISPEIQYLLGLSQIAYIAGKAIPSDAIRRLDQSIAALTQAERQDALDGPEGRQKFAQARDATGEVLREIFGDRFRAQEFAVMEPRQAIAGAGA